MNLIAVDIGNTNINIALFLEGKEKTVVSIAGESMEELTKCLEDFWQQIPVLKTSREKKRDGVVAVSSVKPAWVDKIKKIVKENLGEKIYVVGKDIPFPIDMSIKKTSKVGTDRVLSAAAAFSVVEKAVVVADFGTAITIDMVDDRGVFVGGAIMPGFKLSADALNRHTAQLPKIEVTKPKMPFGQSTEEAINCGIYYSAIGALQEIIRRYAEAIGTWPRTIVTGSAAKLIIDDCEFIDTYVPNLVVNGIALAYRKYIESRQ